MLIYKPNKNLTKIRQPHLPVPFLFFFSSAFHSPAAALLRWSVGAPLLTLLDLYGKASQADLTRLRPNCPPGGNRLCRTSFTLGATRRQSCFRSVQLTDRLRNGSWWTMNFQRRFEALEPQRKTGRLQTRHGEGPPHTPHTKQGKHRDLGS